MKKTIAALVLLIGYNVTLFPRIGETEQQIEARYGKSIGDAKSPFDLPTHVYLHNGFVVTATFLKGICQQEIISKENKSSMSEAEAFTLIDANSNGKAWTPLISQDYSTDKRWKRLDDKIRAISNERSVLIMSTEFFNYQAQRNRDEREAKLKDF